MGSDSLRPPRAGWGREPRDRRRDAHPHIPGRIRVRPPHPRPRVTPIPVAILGATGMVGQRLVQLLARHPTLRVAELCASDRSAGRRYGEAAPWRLEGEAPLAERVVLPCDPDAVRSNICQVMGR